MMFMNCSFPTFVVKKFSYLSVMNSILHFSMANMGDRLNFGFFGHNSNQMKFIVCFMSPLPLQLNLLSYFYVRVVQLEDSANP